MKEHLESLVGKKTDIVIHLSGGQSLQVDEVTSVYTNKQANVYVNMVEFSYFDRGSTYRVVVPVMNVIAVSTPTHS